MTRHAAASWPPPELRRGKHLCSSCGREHYADYATWCRPERVRIKPWLFERWPEEEHAKHDRLLTYAQQQAIWEHMDVWEAVFDEQITLSAALTTIEGYEPLPEIAPKLSRAVKAMVVSHGPRQIRMTPNLTESEYLAGVAKPVEA